MASNIVSPNPQEKTVIRQITDSIVTFSAPFERFGVVKVGGRGTAVRLQNGTVAVFSPTALSPSVRETVQNLGEVKYISALDIEHHLFISEWAKAYPTATVIGVEGLAEKRQKAKGIEHVPFGVTFTAKDAPGVPKVDEAFDREFDVEFVHGHMNKELVFNHRPSRTLIEADLLFNLPAHEQYSKAGAKQAPVDATSGLFTKLFVALNSTANGATWQKRFIWYAISSGDRPAYNKSVARIAGWDFDRVIPCHGDVIETGGKGVLETVLGWHIEAAKKSN